MSMGFGAFARAASLWVLMSLAAATARAQVGTGAEADGDSVETSEVDTDAATSSEPETEDADTETADSETTAAEATAAETETGGMEAREAGDDASPGRAVYPPADSSLDAEAPASPTWGIPLGPIAFAPSAEVWARGEARGNQPVSGADEFFIQSRIRLGLEVRWELVRLFVQVQDARAYGQFPPGDDGGARTGFHQGYVQVGGDDLFFRLGRQEYALGGERMIGPLNWTAPARAFDALRLHGAWGDVEADVIGAVVRWRRQISTAAGGAADAEGDYLGIARLAWAPMAELTLEPYVLFRHDGPIEPPPGVMDETPFLTRRRNILNFGARATGQLIERLGYELEGMIQTGDVSRVEHLAFALAANTTLGLGTPAGLSSTLGINYGSGASPSGDVDEFDNFFPTNHLFYGFADYFGLRNVVDGWLRVKLAPPELSVLKLWMDAHLFAFPEPGARWSSAGGATIGQNPLNDDGFAGGEIDFEVRYTPIDPLFVWAGYALFIPGSGAEALGADGVSHWGYLMLGATLQ